MKKIYNLLFVLGLPAIFLVFTSGVLHHDGSVGGKTGSPGDNGTSCTACHSDNPTINQEFWIIGSELLISGYVPGQTYDIIVTGHDQNANKFGFEATAEDNAGNKVGEFTADGIGFNQTINNNSAITHTALGSVPLVDTLAFWSFTWTAPATNVGEITMYTAVNAANGNGGTSGDQIYLSQFSFSLNTVGIDQNKEEAEISVFPVPSTGLVNIVNSGFESENNVSIVNLMGQVVYKGELTESQTKLDLSDFEKGIYFINIGNSTQRIILH